MAVAKPVSFIQASESFFKSIEFPQRILSYFQVFLAACFMGICSQIEIPLYFTPVPLTVQTTGVMLIGAFLGARKGAYAIFCYWMQGLLGFPVWAGGASGLVHFIGPTGGYLMGYIIQASFIGGWLEKQRELSFFYTASILLISVCFQLTIGSLWLAQFVGMEKCLAHGFYPFILSEFARALLTAVFINSLRKRSTKP